MPKQLVFGNASKALSAPGAGYDGPWYLPKLLEYSSGRGEAA